MRSGQSGIQGFDSPRDTPVSDGCRGSSGSSAPGCWDRCSQWPTDTATTATRSTSFLAGRHPDWGYVDRPWFTPLLSAASVALFGPSPLAVRQASRGRIRAHWFARPGTRPARSSPVRCATRRPGPAWVLACIDPYGTGARMRRSPGFRAWREATTHARPGADTSCVTHDRRWRPG